MHDRRVAVVTGGSGRLGVVVVRALLDDGWRVWVPWVRAHEEARLREATEGAPSLRTVQVDLTDPVAVERLFADVAALGGRLDLLCNLVGGFAAAPVEETDPADWHRLLGMNATAPFLAIRSAVPLFRASGGGRIVNVAAGALLSGPKAGMSAYLASKAALASLTANLAEELAPAGVTVNAVAPSVIDTPENRDAMPAADRSGWLEPAEIADVVRFLAGPAAGIVTGNVLGLKKG